MPQKVYKPSTLLIAMNKIIGILLGLIFLLVPIYAWIAIPGGYWGLGDAALIFLKGGLMWLVLLVGAVSLLVGLSSLKN